MMHVTLNKGSIRWIKGNKAYGRSYECSCEIDIMSETAYIQALQGKWGDDKYEDLRIDLASRGVKWVVAYLPTGWKPKGAIPLFPTDLHYIEVKE